MRVIQLVPYLHYGDAVGNDIFAIRDLFLKWGYEAEIWSEHPDERFPPETAKNPDAETLASLREDDVLIYHAASEYYLVNRLPEFPCRKVLIYHNVTPPAFFQEFLPPVAAGCQAALDQMRRLADLRAFDYCIADSEFNKRDLLEMGYACPIDVCPILIPFQDYEREPSAQRMEALDDGRVNALFVGRGSPNKKQDDVIRAFYAYHSCFNANSRLILVGKWMGPLLSNAKDLAQKLGISEDVIFAEHISFEDLLACYRSADVFVCMSEHEGFCVPLAESMYFDVPIVAYASSAIPDTLGGSGVLLEKKSPLEAAWQIHRLTEDEDWRERVLDAQRRRLNEFSYENVSAILERTLLRFIKEREGNRSPRDAAPRSRPAWKRKDRRIGRR